MGVGFAIIAALMVSLCNFLLKKSQDKGASEKGFLAIQLISAGLLAFLLGPLYLQDYNCPLATFLLGLCGGVILGLMLYFMGRSLRFGPPGLTFAIINASCVLPAIFMVIAFGPNFGHHYSIWQALGSAVVVFGFFWATNGQKQMKASLWPWLFFTLSSALMLACYLAFLQWKALHLFKSGAHPFLLNIDLHAASSSWFLVFVFLSAGLMMVCLFFKENNPSPTSRIWGLGILGAFANIFCSICLIKSTEVAAPFENAIIFPVYCVFSVVICNIWGQLIFKEKVHWKANVLSLCGIVIATVQWDYFTS